MPNTPDREGVRGRIVCEQFGKVYEKQIRGQKKTRYVTAGERPCKAFLDLRALNNVQLLAQLDPQFQ